MNKTQTGPKLVTDPRQLPAGRDAETKARVAAARKLRAGQRVPYAGRKARFRGKLVKVLGFRRNGGLVIQPPTGAAFPCSPFAVVLKKAS